MNASRHMFTFSKKCGMSKSLSYYHCYTINVVFLKRQQVLFFLLGKKIHCEKSLEIFARKLLKIKHKSIRNHIIEFLSSFWRFKNVRQTAEELTLLQLELQVILPSSFISKRIDKTYVTAILSNISFISFEFNVLTLLSKRKPKIYSLPSIMMCCGLRVMRICRSEILSSPLIPETFLGNCHKALDSSSWLRGK